MTKKIFGSICIVALTVFMGAFVLITGVLYGYFSDMSKQMLRQQTDLAALAAESGGAELLSQMSDDELRITLIDSNGKVLYDNMANSAEMENHLQREEIKEALQTGEGESSRYSSTLLEQSFYRAVRLKDGTVLRLAVSQYTWWTLLISMLQPLSVITLMILGLSLFMAFNLSQRIVQPLNKLNLDEPGKNEAYEELDPLIKKIENQQSQLKMQKTELQRKRDELETATENLTEGFILLNENGEVLSINRAACRLLGISSYVVGKNLLLFANSVELKTVLQKAADSVRSEMRFNINENEYQLNASPIITNGKTVGAALIIFDVTESEKAEKMRREFTSNVSHELKTPLQTISGWAELLSDGLVKEGDVDKISAQIYSEAKRLIDLVEDIINLSHLDEGAADIKTEEVDLMKIAEESAEELKPAAEAAQVSLKVEGESVKFQGAPKLLSSVVYNLCDNAIKYNKKGGEVKITVKKENGNAVITVSDTGVGIPADQTERIFERFYRVDKSRSKEVGGTGLGLSIVKHAVKLYGGDVKAESEQGKGTCITVTLPCFD